MNDSNPQKTTRRWYRFAGLLVLSACLLPGAAWGNAGPPTRGGSPFLAEPVGIKGVGNAREHLTIDFRRLPNLGSAEIEAVYQLYNRGPQQKLDLVFVTGVSGTQVTVPLFFVGFLIALSAAQGACRRRLRMDSLTSASGNTSSV